MMFLWLCPQSLASVQLEIDKSKAVILAYHRIGEDHIPSENLSIEDFENHIKEFQSGNYNILSLSEIIEATQNGSPLPPRTIGITLEGAYTSAFQNAIPALIKAELPFTVFYSADNADQNTSEFLNWAQLKELNKNSRITLASLPASYAHMSYLPKTDILKSLNRARQKHREELGHESPYLSYPFGEYTTLLKELAQQQGFKAAFSLHSGAVFKNNDLYALPRFSMTEGYGDLDRLRDISQTLPLPAREETPQNPELFEGDFHFGFTVDNALEQDLDKLSCFLSDQPKPSIERLGARIEIKSTEPVLQNRLRLNCTLPGTLDENDEIQWRWFSRLFHRNETSDPEPEALP